MNLLKRKSRMSLNEFCRDFYDTQILDAQIAGMDAGLMFLDAVRQSLLEVDSSLISIPPESFNSEMIILRFEVFALAWLHQCGDKLSMAQSEFTKTYLSERGRLDIWEAMEAYNRCISRSTIGEFKVNAPGGRAYHLSLDKKRLETFKRGAAQGFDPQCVARVTNRISTEGAWKKHFTPGFLMLAVCDRLDCDLNKEAQFRLTATIVGLYNGAREALSDVKIES